VAVASRLGELGGRIRHQDTPLSGLTGWERGDSEHETDRQTQVGVFSSALDLGIGAPGPPDLPQKPEMRIGKQNTLHQ
jgi:hypothetical protein